MPFPTTEAKARNEQASEWMHRGIALLEQNSPAQLEEAVLFFDRAIALRRTLPLAENPEFRYGLAAGWMNRGDALTRLGSPDDVAKAVNSYDEALILLRNLPWLENPLYRRRLVIAWINRGLAGQKRAAPDTGEATRCFREALAVMENSSAGVIADQPLLEAGAWTNLASAGLDDPHCCIEERRQAAQKALELVRDSERSIAAAAEIGFKARHALCRALAHAEEAGETVAPLWLEDAIEAVDEAMALAREWEQQGETRFRELAGELFRFGCRIYQIHRPRFLAEFILESFDGKGVSPLQPGVREAAQTALWQALEKWQKNGFSALATGQFEQVLAQLGELRGAEERLQQLLRAEGRIPA
jgi:tetratricopeptide (TPR) repeat protein